MADNFKSYEDRKKEIYSKKEYFKSMRPKGFSYDDYEYDDSNSIWEDKRVGFTDVMQVGSKVLIGGGIGLLGGVAAIAVAASAAEVVITGAITKIAGVVGGAAGLSWGLHSVKKKKEKEAL
ncbi:MAG: hypothetical protein HQK64_04395 [Desulfamplus sp.]|nr:hypothetical protein [Desulfamplus sp.]MBF0388576.1 hypothetical protein [Desulfamplus sp.]